MPHDVDMDTSDKVCPLSHEVGRYPSLPEEDYYRERPGNGLCCSFCGSLNPTEFMELIKDGAEVGPTDKNYKVYVRHPSLSFGKFYFQHLSKEQKLEFIDLLNAKSLKIGMPGHFYVKPFFIA